MRAVVLSGPGDCAVTDVPVPVAEPGEVVVDVERVGVCGTDVELFTGELNYLHTGHSSYPLRPGHEWCGRVSGGRRRRRGVARPPGHGRHDARRPGVPALPPRAAARVRAPRGGRHP